METRRPMVEGLVDSLTNENLPLKSSVVFAEVNGFTSRVSAKLVYINERDFDVGCVFLFPQNLSLCVVDFEARVCERDITIDFCELSAPEVHCVYTPELERDGNKDEFVVFLGEIPRKSSVQITITYIEELRNSRNGATRFALPTVLTPKCIPDGKLDRHEPITKSNISCEAPNIPSVYKFNFRLEINSPCLLAGVWSPTHELRVDAESSAQNATKIQVTLDKPHTCDRELEIFLFLSQPLDPYVATQEGLLANIPEKLQIDPLKHILNFPVLTVTLTPELRNEIIQSEFIFCVDIALRSSAYSLRNIKEGLILLVKSLPVTSFFNIVAFYGSSVESLFPEPVAYVKINLNEALRFIKSLRVENCAQRADNDFFTAMEKICLQTRRNGSSREIFLFSASNIHDNHSKVNNIRKIFLFTRLFSFSLKADNCHRTLHSLSDATGGRLYVLSPEHDRLQNKVISALQLALEPAVSDIEIKWCLPEGYDIIQSPHTLQSVYASQRLMFYGFLLRPQQTNSHPRLSRQTKSQSTSSVKEFWMEDDIECRENEADNDIFDMYTGGEGEHVISDDDSCSSSVRNTDYRSFYKMQHTSVDYDVMNGRDFSPLLPNFNNSTVNISLTTYESTKYQPDDVINDVTPGSNVYKAISLEMLDIDNGDENKIRKVVDAVLHGSLGTNADGSEMHFDGIPERKGGDPHRETKQKTTLTHLPERDSGFGASLSEDDIGSCSTKSEKSTTPMSPPNHKIGQAIRKTSLKTSTSSGKIPIPRNTGLISVTGFIGQKKYDALVPFPLERDVTCEGDLSTIHQLAGRSLINDLELSLGEDASRDDVIKKIVHVSKVAHLPSKYTSVVSESCHWTEPVMCLFDKIPLTEKTRRRKKTASTKGMASTASINEQQYPGVELQDFTDSDYTRSTSDNLSDSDDTILTSDNLSACSSLTSLNDFSDNEDEPESQRTSLNIPKIKVQFVDKKYPTDKAFIGLVTAQLPQGNWRLNSKFAQTIGLTEEELQMSCPLADETYYPDEALWELLEMENWPDVASIWSTCIALTWLEKKCAERKEEWILVAAKANEWLRTHPFPRGFKLPDVMTSAKQAYALINRDEKQKKLVK